MDPVKHPLIQINEFACFSNTNTMTIQVQCNIMGYANANANLLSKKHRHPPEL